MCVKLAQTVLSSYFGVLMPILISDCYFCSAPAQDLKNHLDLVYGIRLLSSSRGQKSLGSDISYTAGCLQLLSHLRAVSIRNIVHALLCIECVLLLLLLLLALRKLRPLRSRVGFIGIVRLLERLPILLRHFNR